MRWIETHFARACLLAALTPSAACSIADSSTREAATREIPSIEFSEDLELVGGGPPGLEFTSITDVAIDSKGHVYAADWFRKQIVVLGTEGNYLRAIGRGGRGPGEFEAIRDVTILRGDSILVFDPILSRATLFPPDSDRPVDTLPITVGDGISQPFHVWPGGASNELVVLLREAFVGTDPAVVSRVFESVVRLRMPDRRTEMISRQPAPRFLAVSRGGQLRLMPDPFRRRSWLAVAPDGSVLIADSTGALRRIDRTGTSRVVVVPEDERLPVRPGEVAEIVESHPKFAQPIRDAAPEWWPAVHGLLVDPDGRIWICIDRRPGRPERWIVHGAGASPLAQVVLPAGHALIAARGSRLVTVSSDTLDVPSLAIFHSDSLIAH